MTVKTSRLFLLGLLLAVFSPICRASFICGTHDPAKVGRIKVDGAFAMDAAGNTLNVYCVDDIYFEAEIVRADGSKYPFAKCVYDLGANGFYVMFNDSGNFKSITWANVDVDNSGKTVSQLTAFLTKMDDETMAQWLARINDLIKTKGLNSNIYMTSFSPGDQEIDQDLLGVDQPPIFLTPSQAVVAYDPLNPIPVLQLDPDMLIAPFNHPQEAAGPVPEPGSLLTSLGGILLILGLFARPGLKVSRFWAAMALLACALAPAGRAAMLTVDLTYGPPSPGVVTITPTTSSTSPSYNSNGLNFGIANDGDGVALNFSSFSADCVIFQDLSLNSFGVGDGLDFGILQGDPASGDESDLRLFEIASSVQIKVVEKTANVTTTLTSTVAELNMADIKDVRIDWVPFAGRIDRIFIEITTATGQKITKGEDGSIRSNFVHDPTRKSAYRLTGLNISKDPQVAMGSVMLLDTHTPEPSTFALLGAGISAVVLLRVSRRAIRRDRKQYHAAS
jgi:hypothetical protein